MKMRFLGACCLLLFQIAVAAAQGDSGGATTSTDLPSSPPSTYTASPPTVTDSDGSSSTTIAVTTPTSSSSTTSEVIDPAGSSSTTIAVTTPTSSSSTTSEVIDLTGSSSTTTPEPSTGNPTSTAKPSLPKEEVLQQTKLVLSNITSSINVFLVALDAITTVEPTTATTEGITTVKSIYLPVMAFLKREQKILMEASVQAADLNTICDTSDKQCREFIAPLLDIQEKLSKLTTQTDTWQESDLDELKGFSDDLAVQVDDKTTDIDFMTNVVNKSAAQSVLGQMVTDIAEASTAVDAAIDDLNNNNGVIFVAVFCSVGGLIVLALFIGLTVTCVKSKKAKKGSKSKKYSKVPEERVPVEGFKRGLDNDAYHDEERGNAQHDSYAMRNVSSRGPAPHSSTNDPYARAPGGRHEDPYAAASKPKAIADYYAKPGTSRADDYYSREGSTRDDGHHARQGSSRTNDPYARPGKGPSQGGMNRYYY